MTEQVINSHLTQIERKYKLFSQFVTLTRTTAKGAISIKAEFLEEIDHPLAKLLVKYSELQKFIGTYIKPLSLTKNHSTRMKYSCCNVPTGRLSTGGARNNSYYMPMNIQAIPKKEEQMYIQT